MTEIVLMFLFVILLVYIVVKQYRIIKELSNKYNFMMSFIDKVLNNISIREGIDVQKYINMTSSQLNSIKKGGEDDE